MCFFVKRFSTVTKSHFNVPWVLKHVKRAEHTDTLNIPCNILLFLLFLLRVPWQCVPDVGRGSQTVCWRQWASVSMPNVSAAAPAPAYLRGRLSSLMTTTTPTVSKITTGEYKNIYMSKTNSPVNWTSKKVLIYSAWINWKLTVIVHLLVIEYG